MNNLMDALASSEYREKIKNYWQVIKFTINKNWVKTGLRQYAVSQWQRDFSAEDPHIHYILDILDKEKYLGRENFKDIFKNKLLVLAGDNKANQAKLYNGIGNLLFDDYRDKDAIYYYQQAIELNKEPIYFCNLGRTYGNLENWDEMIAYCWKAIELRRDRPNDAYGLDYYYEFLAEGYFNAERKEEFEKLFEESGDFKNEPKKKAIIFNRIGVLLYNAIKDEESLHYYKKAIEFDSDVAVYYANLGLSYSELKQWNEAIEVYQKAVILEYSNAKYHNTLGNAYWDIKDWEKAIVEYKEAIKFDTQPIYLCNLGRTYGRLEQWHRMIRLCQKTIELRRKRPSDAFELDYYYEYLAEGYFMAGRLIEFIKIFEETADFSNEPDKQARIYNRIGNLFFKDYRDEEAIPYYQQAIEIYPQSIYLCNLGRAYGNMEDWEKMIEYCRQAVEFWRDNPTDDYGLDYYYEFLAQAYFDIGRTAEFIKFFEGSGDFKDEPALKAVIYNQIGHLFFEKNRDKEAILFYKKAIKLDPKNDVYRENLAKCKKG